MPGSLSLVETLVRDLRYAVRTSSESRRCSVSREPSASDRCVPGFSHAGALDTRFITFSDPEANALAPVKKPLDSRASFSRPARGA